MKVLKVFDYEKLVEVASMGLDAGAHMRSATTMEWDLAPKCQSPVFRQMTARGRDGMKVWQHTKRSVEGRRDIEFQTRCRKCPPCLRQRSAFWRFRAVAETLRAPRTWFVTLTLSPESHFKMLCRASLRLSKQGADFERLEEDEQFVQRHVEIGRELTLWLKRVRKRSGAKLRYCLVAERHKSGLPHYHLLVHECGADAPVRAAVLRDSWKLGFSQCKLVAQGDEAKSASYVAKYLAKHAAARVRASQGYGQISVPSERSENIDGNAVVPRYDPQRTTTGGVFRPIGSDQ